MSTTLETATTAAPAETVLARRPMRAARGVPLWLQLKHALRDLIAFDLQPGARLPSELAIAAHHGVSRVTVRQAVEALADEGLLTRRRGVGAFVAPPRLVGRDSTHFLGGGFDGAAPEEIDVVAAEAAPAPEWIAHRLGVAPGSPVWKIRKRWRVAGEAAALRTSFAPAGLAPALVESADLRLPLHEILERDHGRSAESAEESIEHIIADAFRAEMLGVREGRALMLVERLVRDAAGTPLELSRTYFRADRFRFTRTLRRERGAR